MTAAVLQFRESCDTLALQKPYRSDILATPQMLELPMGSMLAGYMLACISILCAESLYRGCSGRVSPKFDAKVIRSRAKLSTLRRTDAPTIHSGTFSSFATSETHTDSISGGCSM